MKYIAALRCDWCEETGNFDTEEEALDAGWFRLLTENEEYDFCSSECLIAKL
jgi:hypothetical protein